MRVIGIGHGSFQSAPEEPPPTSPLAPLAVASGGRYLEADNVPVFLLIDTAWRLCDLSEEDAETYFAARAAQGFNGVAFCASHMLEINRANAYGHRPLSDTGDLTSHVAEYWQHVRWLVDTAASHGLYACVLPCWGKTTTAGSSGSRFVEQGTAAAHGAAVGSWLHDRDNVNWWVGGDVTGNARVALFRNLAAGLDSAGATQLKSFHPIANNTSRNYFDHATLDLWLAYSIGQTGHGWETDTGVLVGVDYARTPVKPCYEGEPLYEHFGGFGGGFPGGARSGAWQMRRNAWWAVLAGGCGFTYGHHSVWQMYRPGEPGITSPDGYWYESLDADGADHVGVMRTFLASRAWHTLEPAQDRITAGQQTGVSRIACAVGDGLALVYTPSGHTFTLNMTGLPTVARWVNPETADTSSAGSGPSFDPPGSAAEGNDWVLALETS